MSSKIPPLNVGNDVAVAALSGNHSLIPDCLCGSVFEENHFDCVFVSRVWLECHVDWHDVVFVDVGLELLGCDFGGGLLGRVLDPHLGFYHKYIIKLPLIELDV